jgi:hypothetical protein
MQGIIRVRLACLLAAVAVTACAGGGDQETPAAAAAGADGPGASGSAGGCIAGGGGFLQAQLRGAITADVAWSNPGMRCEGGPRPDGRGLRLTLAGPAPEDASRQLRFIFGIDYQDAAAGVAQALPTNVTVILEGGGRMFATRGDERCAVEKLERVPLPGGDAGLMRVHVRGYCVEPAGEMAGDGRLLIPTFEFTGIARAGESP